MRKILFSFMILCLLFACKTYEGKIELRKTKEPCLDIPVVEKYDAMNFVFVDSFSSSNDTVGMKRQKERNEKFEREYNERYQNLQLLSEKKNQLVKETRAVYLINTSNSNAITFTVKISLDDSYKTSNTVIYKLNPGEEQLIGCERSITDDGKIQIVAYQIVGQKK